MFMCKPNCLRFLPTGGGDKDSRDLVDIDRERRLRRGEDVPDPREIGGFERHTKVWRPSTWYYLYPIL